MLVTDPKNQFALWVDMYEQNFYFYIVTVQPFISEEEILLRKMKMKEISYLRCSAFVTFLYALFCPLNPNQTQKK